MNSVSGTRLGAFASCVSTCCAILFPDELYDTSDTDAGLLARHTLFGMPVGKFAGSFLGIRGGGGWGALGGVARPLI